MEFMDNTTLKQTEMGSKPAETSYSIQRNCYAINTKEPCKRLE